ncbi:flagellar hook-associated protein FlgK [Nocardioides mangrovicus]|uniref:Flagellar hook-associated protein 1 n=1 Tax=Nocardioides mangrovicus TaxID=2478913 RepID=A0A3L8P0Z2_9ACTN|nr:flagellar hook-associated protein FlgK [Nocardioides mangrovicus]RLV48794.1 flagellar hook-associated protein FlgK [Nocardioides mangrovicus]
MSSFSTLNTALTALQYNRAAMDVASGNVANASTEGYTRRTVDASTIDVTARVALWSRQSTSGQGVKVDGVTRLSDELINARVRREHGTQSGLDVQQASLERVEDGIGEPGSSGLAAMMTDFRTSWSTLENSPTSSAARAGVLTKAASVVSAVKNQVSNINSEAGDQRSRTLTDVNQVNTLATNLASLNRSISAASAGGTDTSALLDSRDQVLQQLSSLTGAVASIKSDGSADVSINGTALVSGTTAGTFGVASGITSNGDADGSLVTFSITSSSGTATSVGSIGGELGGVATLLNTTFPSYLSSLSAVVTGLADQVNSLHESGYDADGNAGGAFFSYSSSDPLGTFAVAITDPQKVAASSTAGGGTDTGIADQLSKAGAAESSYQRLVSTFGTQVADIKTQASNQQIVTTQVDNAKEQLGGVSLDEEMVNMVTAQHAYEAASRVMTTVDEMLDTLINRTGVTR